MNLLRHFLDERCGIQSGYGYDKIARIGGGISKNTPWPWAVSLGYWLSTTNEENMQHVLSILLNIWLKKLSSKTIVYKIIQCRKSKRK